MLHSAAFTSYCKSTVVKTPIFLYYAGDLQALVHKLFQRDVQTTVMKSKATAKLKFTVQITALGSVASSDCEDCTQLWHNLFLACNEVKCFAGDPTKFNLHIY